MSFLTVEEIEASLRAARARPDPVWGEALEERLCAHRVAKARPRSAARFGSALAFGLAAVVLVLSLAGLGPLARDGSVKAEQGCRSVAVTHRERVPTLARDSSGKPVVQYRHQHVTRRETRCR